VAGAVQAFGSVGVPLPWITVPAMLFLEVIGGIAMILGLGVAVVGVLMAVNMVGAWMFVHTSPLLSMDGNGPELVIALGLLSLMLAVTGSGRWGLDYVLFGRRREQRSSSTLQGAHGVA